MISEVGLLSTCVALPSAPSSVGFSRGLSTRNALHNPVLWVTIKAIYLKTANDRNPPDDRKPFPVCFQ